MVQVFSWDTVGGDFIPPLDDIVNEVELPVLEKSRRPTGTYDWKYNNPERKYIRYYKRDGTKYYVEE